MAERKKFHIPTAGEMETEKPSEKSPVKSFNKFLQMKKQGKITDACDLDSSIRSTKLHQMDAPKIQESSSKGNTGNSDIKISDEKGKTESTSNVQNKNERILPSTSSISAKPGSSKSSEKQEEIKLATLKPGKMNSILVNPRQRGNPILKHIRSIPWEYGDINPDYLLGQTSCALFLSLRYHQLNPDYIHDRLKKLGKSYELRVLLVQVDVKESHHLVKDLAKICILADCTLILAFSAEEAGRYLETYKVYETKPPDAIMEKTDKDYMSKMTDCLTSIKSVNKTDVMTLLSTFGSLEGIANAKPEDLSLCPGFGPQKAKRVYDLFQEPFIRAKKIRK